LIFGDEMSKICVFVDKKDEIWLFRVKNLRNVKF
jgi:hypothetical protein